MKKLRYYALALLLIAGSGALFYKKVYIPKSTYAHTIAKKGEMHVEIFGIGNVGAEHIYTVASQTGGKIVEINADAGDFVHKGDILVRIDPVDMPQRIEEARLALKKAEQEYVALQKELESLEANEALARITYRRMAKLKERSFTSKAQYDKAKADLEAIRAQHEATQARIASAKTEIERAKKALEGLKIRAALYTISSPVDGYVTQRLAEKDQTVIPAQPILKIVNPSDVWVETHIDERLGGNVKLDQNATVRLRSKMHTTYAAKVVRIDPLSDPVTKERNIDIRFLQTPVPFYINEQAEVHIHAYDLKNTVIIPATALRFYKGKEGVWTLKEGKAHFVALETLAVSEGKAAVKGLKEGTTILLPSSKNKPLREGSRVHL
jgi:RND family efflux transporter MFP subunit